MSWTATEGHILDLFFAFVNFQCRKMKGVKILLVFNSTRFLRYAVQMKVHVFGKLFKYCVTIHIYACVFVHLCGRPYMYVYIHMGVKNLNIGWSAIGT